MLEGGESLEGKVQDASILSCSYNLLLFVHLFLKASEINKAEAFWARTEEFLYAFPSC